MNYIQTKKCAPIEEIVKENGLVVYKNTWMMWDEMSKNDVYGLDISNGFCTIFHKCKLVLNEYRYTYMNVPNELHKIPNRGGYYESIQFYIKNFDYVLNF